MATRKAKAKTEPQTRYLVSIAGASTTIIEASSEENAAEEFLFQHGYLPKGYAGEPRRHLIEQAKKHKPYLFDRLEARVATTEEMERYAALVDITQAPKATSKPAAARTKVRDRLFPGVA